MFLSKKYRLCIFPFVGVQTKTLVWLSTSSRCLRFLRKIQKNRLLSQTSSTKAHPKKSNLSTNPSNLTTYDFNKTSLFVYHLKNFPKFPNTIDIPLPNSASRVWPVHQEQHRSDAPGGGFVRQKWWESENVDGEPSLSHRIHGTGVFTYMNGWFVYGKCWQIYQSHGSYGYTSWSLRFLVLTYLLVSVNTCQERIPWEKHATNLLLAGVYCIFIAADDRERVQVGGFNNLKNISQIGSFPQVGVKVKDLWNHHPVCFFSTREPGVFTGTQLTSRDPGKYPSSSRPCLRLFSTKITQQISLNLPMGYMGVLQISTNYTFSWKNQPFTYRYCTKSNRIFGWQKDLSSLQALQLLLKFHSEVLEIVDLQKAKAWAWLTRWIYLTKEIRWRGLLSMASQPTTPPPNVLLPERRPY